MRNANRMLRRLVIVLLGLILVLSCTKKEPTKPEEPKEGEVAWEKTFGGSSYDDGSLVQQTSDGGYIIVGTTMSFGAVQSDIYLIKTDTNGNLIWKKIYGGNDICEGRSVQQTSDGGYIIAGIKGYYSAFDVWLIKTDAQGETLWTKAYGGTESDEGYSVQETEDGGYIITGKTNSFGAAYADIYLIKTDENGDTLWTKLYGGDYAEIGYSVQQTTDGGYIIAGYTASFGEGLISVYLLKIDASGNLLWDKTYGGSGMEEGYSVQETSDGGFIIAGWTDSFGSGYYAVYLIKTDGEGNTVWTKTYGGEKHEKGHSVYQTTDGGYIIAGWTDSFGEGYSDVYVIKTDANGDSLWTRTYGGTKNDWGHSIYQTSDGGYIITGTTSSYGAGEFDVYLLKIEP